MVIRPILVDEHSPFLEESCALCKEPFALEEEIVVCPDDATRHHVLCWEANDNRCTAYGCTGRGEISYEDEAEVVEAEPVLEPDAIDSIAFRRRSANGPGRTTRPRPETKVRAMPSSTFGCAQGCLVLGVALAIVLMSVSCFGLWAIMDYLMLEVFNFDYRLPLSEMIRPGGVFTALSLSFSTISILR
jgi:hypothetical protein